MVHEHPLTVQQVQTHISRVNSSCCADLYLLKWSRHTFNCHHIRVKISVPSGGCWLFLNDRYFYSVYLRYRLVTVSLDVFRWNKAVKAPAQCYRLWFCGFINISGSGLPAAAEEVETSVLGQIVWNLFLIISVLSLCTQTLVVWSFHWLTAFFHWRVWTWTLTILFCLYLHNLSELGQMFFVHLSIFKQKLLGVMLAIFSSIGCLHVCSCVLSEWSREVLLN